MWRWRNISETLVGTLADTRESGLVAFDWTEWDEVVDYIRVGSLATSGLYCWFCYWRWVKLLFCELFEDLCINCCCSCCYCCCCYYYYCYYAICCGDAPLIESWAGACIILGPMPGAPVLATTTWGYWSPPGCTCCCMKERDWLTPRIGDCWAWEAENYCCCCAEYPLFYVCYCVCISSIMCWNWIFISVC